MGKTSPAKSSAGDVTALLYRDDKAVNIVAGNGIIAALRHQELSIRAEVHVETVVPQRIGHRVVPQQVQIFLQAQVVLRHVGGVGHAHVPQVPALLGNAGDGFLVGGVAHYDAVFRAMGVNPSILPIAGEVVGMARPHIVAGQIHRQAGVVLAAPRLGHVTVGMVLPILRGGGGVHLLLLIVAAVGGGNIHVLLAGGGGKGAKTLAVAGLLGGLYDFAIATFGAWGETISTTFIGIGHTIADKAKVVLKLNTGAAVLGLGYIIGFKYSLIICLGSLLVWLIIIPAFNLLFGGQVLDFMGSGIAQTVGQMSADEIFRTYARHIGIGGIATAGIIGIIRNAGVIKSAIGLAGKEFGKKSGSAEAVEENDRDIKMKTVVTGIVLALLAVFAFFAFGGVVDNVWQALVGLLIVAVISFLFTTVAANAIAIVGSNPVSGMTIMTLIITALVLVAVGLKGNAGMVAAMVIGGVVCTALSMAGGFITDLKIGYNLGTTPAKQESWKFLGTLVAAATVGGVMLVLNKTYGFVGEGALVAPQANAMAAVIQPMMNGGSAPWLLYGIGAAIAILLTVCKVPALAFCLGMFIPLDLNLPLLVGGAISWYVSTRSTDKALNEARQEKGTLIASGFIAGGALMGVVSAILKFAGVDWFMSGWNSVAAGHLASGAEIIAVVPFLLLIIYMIRASLRKD